MPTEMEKNLTLQLKKLSELGHTHKQERDAFEEKAEFYKDKFIETDGLLAKYEKTIKWQSKRFNILIVTTILMIIIHIGVHIV